MKWAQVRHIGEIRYAHMISFGTTIVKEPFDRTLRKLDVAGKAADILQWILWAFFR